MMLNKSYLKGIVGSGVIAGLGVALTFVIFGLPSSKYTLDQSAQASPFPASVEQTPSPILAETDSVPCQSYHDRRPVAYKRLSDETSIPFIMFGRPVPADNPYYQHYQASIPKFPNVMSCLMNSQKNKKQPNLNKFDWGKIHSRTDAEVCLFRVFSSISAIDDTRQWLQNQGFWVEDASEVSPELFYATKQESPGAAVNASWSIKECGAKFRSGETTAPILPPYSFTVSVRWTADGEVDTTRVVFNTL